MSNLFGYVDEVDSHNKSRHSDLALEKFRVTRFVCLQLFKAVAMVMNVTNFWKLFFVGLRDITIKILFLSDNYWNNLLLIASIILFQLILVTRKRTYLSLMMLIL